MWNPFSKESVLRDLRRELSKIEGMDSELWPTLERAAEIMPIRTDGTYDEAFKLSQKLTEAGEFVRTAILALEEGHRTTGQVRASSAFLPGNVREYDHQLKHLKRKDYWVHPGDPVRNIWASDVGN